MRAAGLALTVGELLAALDGLDERTPLRVAGPDGFPIDDVMEVETRAAEVVLITPTRSGGEDW